MSRTQSSHPGALFVLRGTSSILKRIPLNNVKRNNPPYHYLSRHARGDPTRLVPDLRM
jgi:hypothetical protein